MKIVFWIGMIFTLVAPAMIGVFFKDPSTSWVAALCGAFVTFIAKFEEIAELSLGPVKAKMKAKIEEASATLNQLRAVAATISEGFLADLMAGNFFNGMSAKERFFLHDKVIQSLLAIGVTSETFPDLEERWNRGVNILYMRKINQLVELRENPHTVNFKAPKNHRDAGKAIQDLLDFKTWTAPTPFQIRSILTHHSINDPAINSLISDYDHFQSTREVRSLELICGD